MISTKASSFMKSTSITLYCKSIIDTQIALQFLSMMTFSPTTEKGQKGKT